MIRLIFVLSVVLCSQGFASSILLHVRDAVVWQPGQTVTGELSGFTAEKIVAHHNGRSFSVKVNGDSTFTFGVMLRDLNNKIWVEASGNREIVSDTLRYQLGYEPLPVVKPFATVEGHYASLQATVMENPYNATLQYIWTADAGNPAACRIMHKGSTARVRIPDKEGTYRFHLLVLAGSDSAWFQTFIKRDARGLQPFDMDSGYPSWMDGAVLYQVTPYAFVKDGTFEDITAKLHEIKSLGVNTIWLQPVFESFLGGQGYDVTGYLSVNPEFGSEKQLHHLIATAESLGMRVLFDVVLNHTSLYHPYAQDRIKYGIHSHYYNYYQHQIDGKPYSSYYNQDAHGFINYFWDHLVNLNYKNEEVQRWMLEVCKYWVREYGIDGYRFDAIWGVNARMPSFAERLRTELKSIQPDILMLAEDKGSVSEVFDLGFDAAYDWTADTGWVSQASWEYEYHPRKSYTIFNFPAISERGKMLRKALFHNGHGPHRLLRYMENNDLPRFIHDHGLARTKMAAALLFSLPGIPMVYNGQEVGREGHPYATRAVFQRGRSIQSLDEHGLFSYYRKLIHLHIRHPALRGTEMRPLPVLPGGAMVAFHRRKGKEDFVIIINMDSARAEAPIDMLDIVPEGSPAGKYRLKDILAAGTFQGKEGPLKIPMEGYAVRWLLLQEADFQ